MNLLHRLAALLLVVGFAASGPATAQDTDATNTESDRGFLTGLLEDNLGGEGRVVRIDGFQGALSRRATMAQITIADAQGVWLTINDIEMEWNRSALLRGRIDITQLAAAELTLSRLPEPVGTDLPAPEAQGFSLPELPVAVQIESFEIARITLGAPVLGEQAVMTLAASAQLDAGTLEVDLKAERQDGAVGSFVITADYDEGSAQVSLDLDLIEAKNGIVARLLDIRERPDLRLRVAGAGPLDDLETTVQLQTAGQDRLSGTVTLAGRQAGFGDASAQSLNVDISGDMAPLFPAQYAEFFGDEVLLRANGSRFDTGALSLSRLLIRSGASEIRGAVDLSPDRRPERLAIEGTVASASGQPILLPLANGETRLGSATIDLQYDKAQSEIWIADFRIINLTGPAYRAADLSLSGTGVLQNQSDLSGDIRFSGRGLEFADTALQQAIGDAVEGNLALDLTDGDTLQLRRIDVAGSDYKLAGRVDISGLQADFASDIDVSLQAQGLQRFSALVGVDLSGEAELGITGTADLGGRLNLRLEGNTSDLSVDVAQVDPLLRGVTQLDLTVIRDMQGTRIPSVILSNNQLKATGDAKLVSDGTTASLAVTLYDGTLVDPALQGPLSATGSVSQSAQGWAVMADVAGPYGASATVNGQVAGDAPRLDYAALIPDVSAIVPNVSGALRLDGTAAQTPIGWTVTAELDGPHALTGRLEGRVTGSAAPDISFGLRMPDVRPIAPGYSGALSAQGTVKQSQAGLQVDTALQGPYGLTASINGNVSGNAPLIRYAVRVPDIAPLGIPIPGPLALEGTAESRAGIWQVQASAAGPGGTAVQISGPVRSRSNLDLTAQGSAPLALANPFLRPRSLQGLARFDLGLRGPMSLGSVFGDIAVSGASISDPSLGGSLTDITAQIALANARATVDFSGQVSTGGRVRVQGPVELIGDMRANLSGQITNARLIDPDLFEVRLNGAVRVTGPLRRGALISGNIDVSEATIQIPASQSGGFTIIPQIVHENASAGVKTTLRRAGLGGGNQDASAGSGASLALDLTVSAPSRIFVRGRGLDTELGGRLRLSGRTDQVISSGRFQLIRGRLDVLGKRFVLDEGSVSLQGSADPFLRFVASTRTDLGTASVIIEGRASQPDVRFTSSPQAPQDEVLAQIFFGRSITQLSPFQALQLAGAVASLASGGGDTVLSGLRKSFGLDDLDVNTDAQGNTGLRVGKYLSDNVYTDITVGNETNSSVSVNIDLTPSLRATGRLKADGNSAIGLFFERDY